MVKNPNPTLTEIYGRFIKVINKALTSAKEAKEQMDEVNKLLEEWEKNEKEM